MEFGDELSKRSGDESGSPKAMNIKDQGEAERTLGIRLISPVVESDRSLRILDLESIGNPKSQVATTIASSPSATGTLMPKAPGFASLHPGL